MREIKFRAWNKYRSIMVYENEDNSADYWDGAYMSDVEAVNHVLNNPYKDSYIWMQYTGLKDRNGREIYEGDIVSMFGGTQFSVVEWDEKFGFYRIYMQLSGASDVGEELLGNHLNVVEVIGNIYENPELIER